jgi:hypothetical protein
MASPSDDAAQSALSSKNNSSVAGEPISTEMGVVFHPLLVDQLQDDFPNYMEVSNSFLLFSQNMQHSFQM